MGRGNFWNEERSVGAMSREYESMAVIRIIRFRLQF